MKRFARQFDGRKLRDWHLLYVTINARGSTKPEAEDGSPNKFIFETTSILVARDCKDVSTIQFVFFPSVFFFFLFAHVIRIFCQGIDAKLDPDLAKLF